MIDIRKSSGQVAQFRQSTRNDENLDSRPAQNRKQNLGAKHANGAKVPRAASKDRQAGETKFCAADTV